LTKTLPKVTTEMALSVLANNLTRMMNIVGVKPLIVAVGHSGSGRHSLADCTAQMPRNGFSDANGVCPRRKSPNADGHNHRPRFHTTKTLSGLQTFSRQSPSW
jgi:hypothetical protein